MKPECREYRLGDEQKRAIEYMASQPSNNSPNDLSNFHRHGCNLRAEFLTSLPDDMVDGLRKFHTGEGPPLLVLRNFPTSENVLKGLTYIMSLGSSHEDGKPVALPMNTDFVCNGSGANQTQQFHYDESDPEIVALVCRKGGNPKISTDFVLAEDNGRLYDKFADSVSPELIRSVYLKDGDIVFMRHRELFHARHNHGASLNDPYRDVAFYEINRFREIDRSDSNHPSNFDLASKPQGPERFLERNGSAPGAVLASNLTPSAAPPESRSGYQR